MKNKIISGFCIFLIVFSSFGVYAADDIVAISYDSDEDGVCDRTYDELKEILGEKGVLDRSALRCIPTKYGDKLCPDTPRGEGADRTVDSETSGCSDSELKDFYNYWSIDLKEARPKRVTMNWLMDQIQGVDVFQPLELKENIVIETGEREISLTYPPNFNCYSFKVDTLTGNRIRNGYLRFTRPFPNTEDKNKYTLRFTLKQFTERELSEENIFSKRNIEGRDLEGIEIYCRTQITSCKEKEGGGCERLRGPHEIDEFEVFIPFERLVFHPPEKALEAGAKLADNIINKLDKIVPKLRKVTEFSESICYYSMGLLFLGETVGKIPFFGWLKAIAEKIWDGIGHTESFGTEEFGNKGIIGGKAFCRYFACPKQWCPFAMEYTGKDDTVVQDSLFLSTGCVCFSGMYINLRKLQVILKEWRRCLEAARRSEQYTAYCEKYLSEYLCEAIIGEFTTFKGAGLRGKIYNKIKSAVTNIPGVSKIKEAIESNAAAKKVKEMKKGVEDFSKEVKPIGSAYVKGNLGYKEGTPQLICEYAFYRKWPELDIFEQFKIDPLQWKTTLLGNWNSKVAYLGRTETDAVYEYTISWTIIAGNDNFRYKVHLEREGGGTLPIRGHRYSVNSEKGSYVVDAGSGVLRNAGDLVADYVQITSTEEFDQLCFYVPSEINEKQCFPPGSFDVGGPIGTGIFDEKINDADEDGLADEWEERFNCYEGRSDFENEIDKNACEALLKSEKNNILNLNSKDSDKNNIKDGNENPDDDAFNNYYEQQNNFHPNIKNANEEGKAAEASCYAQFSSMGPTGKKIQSKYKYNTGDNINIQLSLGNDQRLSDRSNLLLMTELKGMNVGDSYYEIETVELSNLKEHQENTVMKIKEDVKSGVYLLKSTLVTQSVLKFEECIDPSTNKIATKEFSLIIVNTNEGICIDSDNGEAFTVEGVCIDNNGVNTDECNKNNLEEWYCNGNICLSNIKECGNTGLCNKGTCIFDNCEDDDPSDNFAFPGICKYDILENGNINPQVKRDFCLDGRNLAQFSCVLGKCEYTNEMCLNEFICKEDGKPATCVKEE